MLSMNYDFILGEIDRLYTDSRSPSVLDYGCGKGQLVTEGVGRGIEIYGVEAFSHGSGINIQESLDVQGLLGQNVLEIKDGKIPFDSKRFDCVVSNTVFEHIPDISWPLKEIRRVLKDDGVFINLFPYKGTIREGHCHIPFAHRFYGYPSFQHRWLTFFRSLGFGRGRKELSASDWAEYWVKWLPENTFYLTFKDVVQAYERQGFNCYYIEHRYIQHRLVNKGAGSVSRLFHYPLFRQIATLVCRLHGGVVIAATPKGSKWDIKWNELH